MNGRAWVAGWREDEQIRINEAIARQPVRRGRAAGAETRGACWQGTKAYGVHVRPIAVPARENRSEMHEQPNSTESGTLHPRAATGQDLELVDPAAGVDRGLLRGQRR